LTFLSRVFYFSFCGLHTRNRMLLVPAQAPNFCFLLSIVRSDFSAQVLFRGPQSSSRSRARWWTSPPFVNDFNFPLLPSPPPRLPSPPATSPRLDPKNFYPLYVGSAWPEAHARVIPSFPLVFFSSTFLYLLDFPAHAFPLIFCRSLCYQLFLGFLRAYGVVHCRQ